MKVMRLIRYHLYLDLSFKNLVSSIVAIAVHTCIVLHFQEFIPVT